MSLVMFILHDPEKLPALLDAWKEAGVSGATVLLSTGLGRIAKSPALRDQLAGIVFRPLAMLTLTGRTSSVLNITLRIWTFAT